MRTHLDCIACLVRQTLDSVRFVTDDEQIHEQVIRKVLRQASYMDMSQSVPAIAQEIHRFVRDLVGQDDPYRKVKKWSNDLALELYPDLKELVKTSKDPLETAVRLAIAGNIIDFGAGISLKESDVEKAIDDCLTSDLDKTQLVYFQNAVAEAKDILFLADNAGEIVFDRLLIEQLGPERVTLVVKAGPILNDATAEDARAVGLIDLVEVIDTGDDAPGTIFKTSSMLFQCYFMAADLVVAKGQGNYETLSDVDEDIFFILKAKCPLIAQHLGCDVGQMVLRRSNAFAGACDLVSGGALDAGV
jgi:uncharacterized protein with ATP-grasp and redox domains